MTRIGFVLAVALGVAAPCWAQDMPKTPASDMPPLVPDGEIPAIAASSQSFASCITAIGPLTNQIGARIGTPHITQSVKWGLVWRADFSLDGIDPPQVNRVVCWNGRVAIAIGQHVAPLDVAL
jgi:hypothetical protein